MDTIKPGHYEVEYITPEVGEHIIEVKALGKPIPGNPFHSSAYDSTKIKVGAIPNGILGKHVQFESEYHFMFFSILKLKSRPLLTSN
jgi:filamin